ncbi:MAG: class I SAM-dependent methyltransferase [bacterium]|nr:class I SAM-dependent methyltransferase [bacterium]MCM1423621.1 class I SAM-dependent methyltransferase [bacterium]
MKTNRKFDRDTEYWDNYYKENRENMEASLFAQDIFEKYLVEKNGGLLEIGCGNGRDSKFFISKGFDVTAIDASKIAIEKLQHEFAEMNNTSFVCGDFVSEIEKFKERFDFCYSRFSLHAINEEQEKILLKNVFEAIRQGGYFFIETRSVHDELYGMGEKVGEDAYFYNMHYRRFIRKEKLKKELEKQGFLVLELVESRGFAPYGNEDPLIIRCIASKGKKPT